MIEISKEDFISQTTANILSSQIKTDKILDNDDKVHPILFNKIKYLLNKLAGDISETESKLIKLDIKNKWTQLKAINVEWAEYHLGNKKSFLINANKHETYLFLDTLKDKNVLLTYIQDAYSRDQVHVFDYGVTHGLVEINNSTFTSANIFGSLGLMGYFVEKGFDVKSDEINILKTAINHGDKEIQKFLISLGCTTENLPMTKDCSWLRSYEASIKLQEKLDKTLEAKTATKKIKI